MKKLGLADWADVSEIVGTLAVVVSLVFVVYSINRNTAVMQVTNENFLYELTDSSLESVVNDSELAAIYVKMSRNAELSDDEEVRANLQFIRYMNRWNLAFDRYQDGMFASDKWNAWNENYESNVDVDSQWFQEWWAENRAGYGMEFSTHIDSIISGK
jgi:hypothetical protein